MPDEFVLSSMATSATAARDVLTVFINSPESAKAGIGAKYDALGGASGILGNPDTEVTQCPDGVGYYRHFWNNASIYYTPSTGAVAVYGAIREKWASLGWERSFLGYPTADVQTGMHPQTGGQFQTFQGGRIYTFTPPLSGLASTLATEVLSTMTMEPALTSTAALPTSSLALPSLATTETTLTSSVGSLRSTIPLDRIPPIVASGPVRPPKPSIANTHEVHGAILSKYLELGGEGSFLGYPTTDETSTPDNFGRYNHFQAGSIYWTPNVGAHEVHGLIRSYWASKGWERNPDLGYPITDELVPDPRIGHIRPESQRKPIASLPSDVLKLPVEARSAVGMSESALNVVTTPRTLAVSATLDPRVGSIGVLIQPQPGSTAAPERSVNRFADFENGVVFWRRGADSAIPVSPWPKAADGTVIHRSAAEIMALAITKLMPALQLGGMAVTPAFAGTTSYVWDGAGLQNRRHRIQVSVVSAGIVPGIYSVQLQVLVEFEPHQRKLVGCLADYAATSPLFTPRLDPLLWSPFDILTYPDMNAGAPYSILSVKTLPNGDVETYIEPSTTLLGTRLNDVLLETNAARRIN